MTDYNDGQIHGWNGGECPVHPKSLVDVREWNGAWWTCWAESVGFPSMRGCFRVVKAYREPRVFWVNEFIGGTLGTPHTTQGAADYHAGLHRIACHRIVID